MDYVEIGATPVNEPCQQLGRADYDPRAAKAECRRFIRNIRYVLGNEPEGAMLRVRSNNHDFGTYYEVACYYENGNDKALEYATKCESEAPPTWVIE